MITLFAVPKSFKGHTGIIQTNAIKSWKKMKNCEIILMGNDSGVREFCTNNQIKHIPDIKSNKYGTPLISSIFKTAMQEADSDIMAYVNSDIILLDSFSKSISQINFKNYLLIGQRWDLDIVKPINFDNDNYKTKLEKKIKEQGVLHPKTGIDYFVFPKTVFKKIPDFAIGRTSWDNWLVYNARLNKYPVINGTQSIDIIHQNHDYGKFVSNKNLDTRKYKKGIESEVNSKLAGGERYSFNLNDCTHNLIKGQVIKDTSIKYLLFKIYRLPRLSTKIFPLNHFIDFSFDILKKTYSIYKKMKEIVRLKSS